jgi:hypothetical protein
MPARARSRTSFPAILVASLLSLWILATTDVARSQAPQAHHPGEWTPAPYWPGTTTATTPGVQAVHMALVRGDTLFGMPHSRVLAWGSWETGLPENGGLWSWNPVTDVGTSALGNLNKAALGTPPFHIFCGSHTSIPSASVDYLMIPATPLLEGPSA